MFMRVLGWVVGPMVLLTVACFADRYTFAVGSVNIRAEQVAALLAVAILVVMRLRKRDLTFLRPNVAEIILLAWFAIGLVSSLFEAPSRTGSLKILGLLVLSSLAMVIPTRLIARDREALDSVVRWFLLAVAIESGYAVLAYFLHMAGSSTSLSVNPATGHLTAYGTMWEPNVLGAVAGAGAIAWTYLGRTFYTHSWAGIAICLVASIVSFTRTAWIAVAVILLLMIATPLRRRFNLRSLGIAAAVTALTVPLLLAIDTFGKYSTGVANSVTNDTDVLGRLYQFRTTYEDLKHSPILGGGIDSFGQRHVLQGSPEHLANVGLAVVNDTGVVGLVVFTAFAIAIFVMAWRARHDATLLGLAGMMLVIAITNQATETLELMITWLMIGLLIAAARAAPPPTSRATPRTALDTGS
jgi:O-antigen ligase